jgi:Fic family protein
VLKLGTFNYIKGDVPNLARGRPSRQSVLQDLDRAKAALRDVGGLPRPEEAQAIWAGIWHEETHHSTAIEGNTMVLRQVRVLLEKGRAVGNKELREYLEIKAYGDAAQWVYTQAVDGGEWSGGDLINVTELRQIHALVVGPVWQHSPPTGQQDLEGPGAFRRQDIQPLASGHTPPPWPDVAAQVHEWLAFANKPPSNTHVMTHLADAHARLQRIHPFLDGNGRTGRLVLNLMLVRLGYPPAIILSRDRSTYLKNLARADRGDPAPLGEQLARRVKDGIDRFVLPGLAGPHRMVPLSALVTRELTLLALRRAAERGRLTAMRRGNQWHSTKQFVAAYQASRRRGRRAADRGGAAP